MKMRDIKQAKKFPLLQRGESVIYYLLYHGIVTYIGKSKNFRMRLCDHILSSKQFDEIWYEEVHPDLLDLVEVERIKQFSPMYNIMHKPHTDQEVEDRVLSKRRAQKIRIMEMQAELRSRKDALL